MQLLKEEIIEKGKIYPGNILKVDSFINQQIDITLLNLIGKEFKKRFNDCEISKILTIEASGIGIACIVAQYFNVDVVFAKKNKSLNMSNDIYKTVVNSFTHKKTFDVCVSKEFLNKDDKILIIDDFLATGEAVNGLIDLVNQAGATLVGAGIVIEKTFQSGGKDLRSKGYRIESLAKIKSIDNNIISFEN